MARIPYPELEKLDPQVKAVYDALPVKIKLFHMLTHAGQNFRPALELGAAILSRQRLSPRWRELAILFVAQRSGARYEWVQHEPIALGVGCTREQVAALERGDIAADCFDPGERVLLAFTREVVERVRPGDAVLAELRRHLSDAEVVELTIAIGYYMLVARVIKVTGVELEAPAGHEVVARLSQATLPDA
jgi:alkylhydroperoxidase family enzyme